MRLLAVISIIAIATIAIVGVDSFWQEETGDTSLTPAQCGDVVRKVEALKIQG
jgi:hypothetical protein